MSDRIAGKALRDLGTSDEQEIGWGAWELAGRVSYIDLNSRDIQGGRLLNLTAGLHWYLTSYARLQSEYIRAALTSPTFGGNVTNLFDVRLQWDF